MQHWQSS